MRAGALARASVAQLRAAVSGMSRPSGFHAAGTRPLMAGRPVGFRGAGAARALPRHRANSTIWLKSTVTRRSFAVTAARVDDDDTRTAGSGGFRDLTTWDDWMARCDEAINHHDTAPSAVMYAAVRKLSEVRASAAAAVSARASLYPRGQRQVTQLCILSSLGDPTCTPLMRAWCVWPQALRSAPPDGRSLPRPVCRLLVIRSCCCEHSLPWAMALQLLADTFVQLAERTHASRGLPVNRRQAAIHRLRPAS